MKLSRRQLDAILNIPDVEVKRDGEQLVARMGDKIILVAQQDGAYWRVSFEGRRWTVPAWIAP